MSAERMRRQTKNQNKRPAVSKEMPASPKETHPTSSVSQVITTLQNLVGNRTVNRLIESQPVLRQVEEPAPEEDTPLDTSGLGKEERLPGHGNTGGPQATGTPEIQRQGGGAVTANMNLTTNAPAERSRPEADIAAAHGRPGVAGWTTPLYNIAVPRASPRQIDINVTMDYDMELAAEYTGDTLTVLRDHEYGHVNIGNQKAQQHLVTNLENSLESQASLTRASIQGSINTAAGNFVTSEGQGSQAYDAMDYPRMQQAYLGARTPLADLETASGNIANLAGAFRNFNAQALAASEERIGDLAQAVLDFRDALSNDELARLQYNTEFKALVTTCGNQIDQVIERFHWDLWIIEFSTLDDAVRRKLDELRNTLGDFTWRPPV